MKRVRQLRELTQSEFAKLLDLPVRTYKNYEMGVRELPIAVAVKLCERGRVSTDWLLLGKGKIGPNPTVADLLALLDANIASSHGNSQYIEMSVTTGQMTKTEGEIETAKVKRELQKIESLQREIMELQEVCFKIYYESR